MASERLPETVAIERLHEDPRNARAHPPRNMAAIKASLERYGQQKDVVASRDGTVLAGNGVLRAAKELGWTTLSVCWTDLEGPEARAFALADNRTAELSEWDPGKLAGAIAGADPRALAAMGWTPEEAKLAALGGWSPGEDLSVVQGGAVETVLVMTEEQAGVVSLAGERLAGELGRVPGMAETIATACDAVARRQPR